MIQFNLPDVKEPRNMGDLLGITEERREEIFTAMKEATKAMQKERFPAKGSSNYDLMQRYIKDIPLNNAEEAFYLGHTCAKIFSKIDSPITKLLQALSNA